MAESSQLSERVSSNKAVVQPVDVPPKWPYFFCEGGACAFQWERSPNHEKLMTVTPTPPSEYGNVYYFCQTCSEKWDKNHCNIKWDVKECSEELKESLSTCNYSNNTRLKCYKTFIANVKKYFLVMLLILLCFPIFKAIPTKLLRKMNNKVQALWEVVPKSQTFAGFVAVYITYIMIALSYPFAPQVVFWAFMELYPVFFFCLNILSQTPIDGFTKIYGVPLNKSKIKNTIRMYMLPSFVFVDLIVLTATVESVSIIASSTESSLIDVKKLHFIDSETKEPLPSCLLPGAFISVQSQGYAKSKSGLTYRSSLILAFVAYIFCLMLTASWVTNFSHNGEFLFPSAYALISSPLNPDYKITASTIGQMCQAVPDANGTQWRSLLNMNIDPVPTKALGIPQLTLTFYSNRTVLSFLVDIAWNINIVRQNGGNVTLSPIDGQNTFSFLATFHNVSNCSIITDNLSFQNEIFYPDLSIQQYLRVNKQFTDLIPLFLIVRNVVQIICSIIYTLICTYPLWDLWLHFDGITEIGLYSSSFENTSTKIDLGIVANLCTWWQLRTVVATASQELTFLIKIIISLNLLQLIISFGGLLYYCIMGIAPMPTYFLLMIALTTSLAPLFFLYPISKAVQIQSSHGDMLRGVLTRHLIEKAQSFTPIDSNLEKYLKTFIDIIDNHDDRICFWGIEMSQERLKGLCVTLVSGLSFIVSKTVQFSWSDENIFYNSFGVST